MVARASVRSRVQEILTESEVRAESLPQQPDNLGSVSAPAGFIATSVLQDVLRKVLQVFDGMPQVEVLPSTSSISQARDEFRGLQQGSLPVSEYETRFHELVGRTATIFPTERDRIQKFASGVILPLRLAVEPLIAVGHTFT